MRPPVQVWRYEVPNAADGQGWAVTVLDSTGLFATVSDFGNYGRFWPCWGPGDFRAAVLRMAPDYVLRKLAPQEDYDGAATLRNVQEAICEARKADTLTREDARDEWEELRLHNHLHLEMDFHAWALETGLEMAWEFHETRPNIQAEAWVARVLPQLKAAIRAELEHEAPAVRAVQ